MNNENQNNLNNPVNTNPNLNGINPMDQVIMPDANNNNTMQQNVGSQMPNQNLNVGVQNVNPVGVNPNLANPLPTEILNQPNPTNIPLIKHIINHSII